MVVIFAPLGEAHGGKSFTIERSMVAAAQITVEAENQGGLKSCREIRAAHFRDRSRELAGRRIALAAECPQQLQLGFRSGGGHTFGENAHGVGILLPIAGGAIAADNVVVQRRLDLPALLFRHFGKVGAAIKALLFAGDGEENNGRGKSHFAEDARAFQRYRGAAGVVVGAGGGIGSVEVVAVARIVVAGDQKNSLRLLRIAATEHCIDVGNLRRLANALLRRLDKGIELDFQAAAALLRVALEFALEPIAGRGNAVTARSRLLHRERAAGAEAHQLFDGGANVRG